MLHAARVRGAPPAPLVRPPFVDPLPQLFLFPLHLKSPRDSKTPFNNNNATPGRAIRVQRLPFNWEYAYTDRERVPHTKK